MDNHESRPVPTCSSMNWLKRVQRLFRTGIGQIELVLQKVNVQHNAQSYRAPTVARLRIMRLDQCLQLAPGTPCPSPREIFPPCLVRVPLKFPCVASVNCRINQTPGSALPVTALRWEVLQRFPGDDLCISGPGKSEFLLDTLEQTGRSLERVMGSLSRCNSSLLELLPVRRTP
jgi:hypothetical protein